MSTDGSIISVKGDAEDPDLLEIFTQSSDFLKICPVCGSGKSFIELEPYLVSYTGGGRTSRSVPPKDRERELLIFKNYFMDRQSRTLSPLINQVIFLRAVHESSCSLREAADDDYIICKNEVYLSKFVKIRLKGRSLHVYLKMDARTIEAFPEMDSSCFDKLCSKLLKITSTNTNGEMKPAKNIRKCKKKVGRTRNFEKHKVAPGFALKLRNYQQRNLDWMFAIEDSNESDANTISRLYRYPRQKYSDLKYQFADTPYCVEINDSKFHVSPLSETPPQYNKIKLNGGVLLDMPGSGKKVTILALIHSKATASKDNKRGINRMHVIDSLATLIVCPQNNLFEWIEEAEKCNPNFETFCFPDGDFEESGPQLRNRLVEKLIPKRDFVDADIVFLTYDAYNKHQSKELENVKFARVIFDNYKCGENRNRLVSAVKADYIWFLGSGPFNLNHVLQNQSSVDQLWRDKSTNAEFTKKYYKKTKFKREPRHIIYSTVNVELLSGELRRIRKSKRAKVELFRSGFPIKHDRTGGIRHHLVRVYSIDQAESLLIHKAQRKDSDIDFKMSLNKGSEKKMKLKPKSQSLLNFKMNVMKDLRWGSALMSCSICHNSTANSRVTLLKCAHAFCFDCIIDWLPKNSYCPLCNKRNGAKAIICVDTANERDQVSRNDCGSKFMRLHNYMIDEFERDPNSRIIIHVQYKAMAGQMERLLKRSRRDFVRLTGSSQQRHDAINTFRTSSACRIIVTCCNDRLSGVHLPEATHLIYYHPFAKLTPRRKTRNFELERRALKMLDYYNSSRSPVNVVRFCAKWTVETHFE